MARLNLPRPRILSVSASPFKRALAFLIDILILDIIVFFPFRLLFSRILPELTFDSLRNAVNNPAYSLLFVYVSFGMGILAVLYFSILEYKIQQTIGKLIVRINVTSDNKENAYWQFLVRNILLIPLFPFVIFWAADVLYMFFNQKRQRLLEIISRTRTMEKMIGV